MSLSGWCSRRSARCAVARRLSGCNALLVAAWRPGCWSPTPTRGCTAPTPFPEKGWGPGRSPAVVTPAHLRQCVSVCGYSGPMRPCGPQRRGTTEATPTRNTLRNSRTDRHPLAKEGRSAHHALERGSLVHQCMHSAGPRVPATRRHAAGGGR